MRHTVWIEVSGRRAGSGYWIPDGEWRGLTQPQAAKLLGTSQPCVAKFESGRIENLGVNTLVKYARTLGGTVTIKVEFTVGLDDGTSQVYHAGRLYFRGA